MAAEEEKKEEKRSDRTYGLYVVLRAVVMAVVWLFKPFRIVHREKLPAGPAVICANHSSFTDPFYMAFAVPWREHLCLMAKKELFRFKPLGWVLRHIGTFPVDREAVADMEAMKNALGVLKDGNKLGIFPEGTRSTEDGAVSPKAGAVRIAQKMGVPLVPMFIPRKKKFFRRNPIIVGDPIDVKAMGRLKGEELERVADELMDKIAALGHTSMATGRA